MAYMAGKGLSFRPVGAAFARGVSDRFHYEQLESKLDSLFNEIKAIKQAAYRPMDSDFPALFSRFPPVVASGPTNNQVASASSAAGLARCPSTLYTSNGTAFLFDPSFPPPLIRNDGRQGSGAASRNAGGRPTTIVRDHPHVTGRPRPVRQPGTSANGHRNAATSDFDRLVNNIFRYLQLLHHRRNWASLPASLDNGLDEFQKGITPPLFNDNVRGSLTDATRQYKESIKTSVVAHLCEQLDLVAELLKSSKPEGVERATQAAATRLQQRFGKRLDARRNREEIEKVVRFIGINFINLINLPVVSSDNDIDSVNVSAENGTLDNVIPDVSTVNSDCIVNVVDNACIAAPSADIVVNVNAMEGIERIAWSPVRTTPVKSREIVIPVSDRFELLRDDENDILGSPFKRPRVQISPISDRYAHSSQSNSPPPLPRRTTARKSLMPTSGASAPKITITVKLKVAQKEERDEAHPSCCKTVVDNKQNISVEITTDTKILIIGDSNLRNTELKDFSQVCHIICIPGANFEITTAFVNAIPVGLNLTDILIASGMCDLSAKSTSQAIKDCLSSLDRLGVRKHFMGISLDEKKVSHAHIANLRVINNFAKADKTTFFISPLKNVRVANDGVHYTLASVKLISDKISQHLAPFSCW